MGHSPLLGTDPRSVGPGATNDSGRAADPLDDEPDPREPNPAPDGPAPTEPSDPDTPPADPGDEQHRHPGTLAALLRKR